MFVLRSDGVYESPLLAQVPGLAHGFATRNANGWPGPYTNVKQIHSDIILQADDKDGCLGRADGLITAVAGPWIGVRTADCVPILIADPERHATAAVHAGWRGTVARIASRAVTHMAEVYGSDPAVLLVAIGPCIAECCFEVGDDVAERFDPLLPQRSRYRYIDLTEANRRQLLECGLQPANIDASGLCTVCHPDVFHSFRRDRENAGRMVAAIRLD